MVNNNTLASICVTKELYCHMLYESPDLFHKIRMYIDNCSDDDYNALKVKQGLEKMNEEEVPKLEQVDVWEISLKHLSVLFTLTLDVI